MVLEYALYSTVACRSCRDGHFFSSKETKTLRSRDSGPLRWNPTTSRFYFHRLYNSCIRCGFSLFRVALFLSGVMGVGCAVPFRTKFTHMGSKALCKLKESWRKDLNLPLGFER